MRHEFDGDKYEQASAHQKEWGERLITELELHGDEHLLDLGCGDGVLSERLAALVPRGEVVGIDASPGMIATARTRASGSLRFLLLDIEDLDFTNEFDLVFSNATLHWVKDHHRLLRNVHRALRPGGVARFNFAGDGNCQAFFAVVREAMDSPTYAHSFAAFAWPWYMPSVEEYAELAAASPLAGARVWGENADRYFPDTETMIRWVDQPSLVPFLAQLAAEDRQRFRDLVVRRMVEETRRDDGRCFETFRRINLFAGKPA